MLSFPTRAYVGRIMPKEAFYKNLTLSREVREKFVSDIKRIVLEYKLAPDTINVEPGNDVEEILCLVIELKKSNLDYRIVENIARHNPHQLLFLIKYADQGQLALYFHKLCKTEWLPLEELRLDTGGFTMDKIWEGFVEQIALGNAKGDIQNIELPIEERLKKQEIILRLQKEIDRLERLSCNEKQPKKRFELYTQLQGLKRQLAGEEGE